MDTFIEYLVQKKKTGADFLAIVGITVAASVLAFMMLFVLIPAFPMLGSIVFILLFAMIYGVYKWITSFNAEYEYVLVNDEIDVDKIIDRKKRKRLTTFNIRKVDAFGKCKNSHELRKYMNNSNIKKILACTDKNDEDVYYAVYSEQEVRKLLLFNPNEKILEVIKKRNPQKISVFEI